MRKISFLLTLFLFWAATLFAKQIKLLTIGNSFSDDAVEHYLAGLAEAAGDTIVIGNMYIGGCSLETHYNNSRNNAANYSYRKIVSGVRRVTPNFRLSDALTDEEWDYVSLQQTSSLSGKGDSFFPYIDHLISYVRELALNEDVEIVLHATWAYAQDSSHKGFDNYERDQLKMYNAIVDATRGVAEKAGIGIIVPAGTAIQNGRTSSLGDTFCRDGYHLQLNYGRYTASCVWYEKLFEKPVIGNDYIPATINPFQARVAQWAAHHAVENPYEVTPVLLQEGAWQTIAPYFNTPAEYVGYFGLYRSPLFFYDGTPVKTKDDWKKRRKEIRNRWMTMMGEWPELIKDQEFEMLSEEKIDDFTRYKVRFSWTPNQKTEGYLLVPAKEGPKPAVITLFYEPETAAGIGGKPHRDFAYQLARRGFITLSLGTTQTTNNKTYSLYYPNREDASLQPLSALAYAAANAFEALAKVKDVDPGRIGVVGHSYGGKWAMFSSSLFEKFACAVWIDPGIVFDETKGSGVNYWEPWYLGYHRPPWDKRWNKTGENAKGLYPRLKEEGYDLHELHALMAPRPFLVSGGSSDPIERWIPLNHTVAVNELLGYNHRVAMSNRPGHSPTVESNEIVYSFFEWFLQ